MPKKPKSMSARLRPPKPRRPELRGTTAQRGYGSRWQRLRIWWLRRHPLCVFCDDAASVVDHKLPLAQGGTNEQHNLRSCCDRCHNLLTANYRRTGMNEMPEASRG